MYLASEYDLAPLRRIVEHRITQSITASNVSIILLAADQHGAIELKQVRFPAVAKYVFEYLENGFGMAKRFSLVQHFLFTVSYVPSKLREIHYIIYSEIVWR